MHLVAASAPFNTNASSSPLPLIQTPSLSALPEEPSSDTSDLPTEKIPPVQERSSSHSQKSPPKDRSNAPKPQTIRMSYKDFIKQQGPPKEKPKKAPPHQPGSPPPKIDTTSITKQLQSLIVGSSSSSSYNDASQGEQEILLSYIQSLKISIDTAWEKPDDLTGDRLTAIVEFTIFRDGSLSKIHLVQTSGNKRFDDSVLLAFRKAKTSPPPQNESYTFRLTFRSIEGKLSH